MPNKNSRKTTDTLSAQPHLHQRAQEIQAYGAVNHALPPELEEPVWSRDDRTARLKSTTCP
jgi:hypothetical protein